MKKIKIDQSKLCLLARCYSLVQSDIVYDGENLQITDDAKAAEIESLLGQNKWSTAALDAIKSNLKLLVDTAAENERLKYITAGVGQSMTYTEKFNQAVDYSKKYAAHANDPKNTPEPNEADYLLLKAGLGIDGKTLIEVAETVTYAYAVWQKIGAAIEATRLESKAAIENAKTAEEAQAVFDTIKWPQPGQLQ